MPARERSRWRVRAFWALFVLMCAAHLLSIFAPLDRDEGAFLTIAQEVLHGRVPYRDVFDQKSPGIYYLLAGLLLVTKPLAITGQILALRVFTVLVNVLSGIGVYQIGKRWWRPEVGEVAALLWLAGSLVPKFGANQFFTEPFASAGVVWAAVCLTRGVNSRSALRAGLLLALGTLFKQTAIIAMIPFAVVILAPTTYTGHVPSGKERLRGVGALVAGVAVPWLVLCLIFAALGGLRRFVYQVALVSVIGYPAAPGSIQTSLGIGLALLVVYAGPVALLIWAIARHMLADHASTRNPLSRPRIAAVVPLLVLQAAPILAHPYPHYLIMAMPWLALLFAVAIDRTAMTGRMDGMVHGRLQRIGRAASPVLITLSLATSIRLAAMSTSSAAHALTTQVTTGARIAAEAPRGASVLVVPAEPEYYYLSGRLPVTPYVYLLPVNHSTYPLAEVTDAIRARRFDVVAWCPDTVQSDSPAAYAAMLQALNQTYRVVPGGDQSVLLFTK